MGCTERSSYSSRGRSCLLDLPTKTSSRPQPRSHSSVVSVVQPHSCAQPASAACFKQHGTVGSLHLLCSGCNCPCCSNLQTGCGFLSGGRRGPPWMTERIAMGERLWHTGYSAYIVSPLDMAGMIGMAQTLAVCHYR